MVDEEFMECEKTVLFSHPYSNDDLNAFQGCLKYGILILNNSLEV